MLSGSDEVVRLVAGRTRSYLEKGEQIDREREERTESALASKPQNRDPLETGHEAPDLLCLPLLLDLSLSCGPGPLSDAAARAR